MSFPRTRYVVHADRNVKFSLRLQDTGQRDAVGSCHATMPGYIIWSNRKHHVQTLSRLKYGIERRGGGIYVGHVERIGTSSNS